MQTAIIGLAGSGKTTVFNTLTRGHAETGGYGGVTLNVGVVKVPDDRLDAPGRDLQAEEDRPGRRHVRGPAGPAAVDRGARRHRGAARRPPGAAARLRRAAPRGPRLRGSRASPSRRQRRPGARPRAPRPRVHPGRPVDDRAPPRAAVGQRPARDPAERESNEREEVILRRLHEALEAGKPIRDVELDVDEEKAIRGFRFLTQKPVLVLLNVGEGDLAGAAERVAAVAAGYDHRHALVDALSARIEMELGELEPDEAAVFMEELGIAEFGAGPGDRPHLSAARADLVPDRRAGRGPRLADPGRVERGGCRRRDPHGPRQGVHPRGDGRPTTTCSRSARWPRRARPASCARRGRPTGCATATSSRSCSASRHRRVASGPRAGAGARPATAPSSGGRPGRSRPGPSGSRSHRGRPRSRPRRARPARRRGPPRGRRGSCPRRRSRR